MTERIDHAKEALRIIDATLAEQDEYTEKLEHSVDTGEITDEQATQLYWNWINHGNSRVVTEADVRIEGSPDVVFYDPNQNTLWD
jgi:hypothetical protein